MIFVYPYRKRGQSDFMLDLSIKSVLKVYPEARIITVGDKFEEFENYPCKDSSHIRGVNVTSKLLHVAQFVDEFVFMNDDFFITKDYNFAVTNVSNEDLERKEGKASIEWNVSVDNTKHFLKYFKQPYKSYECHQPVIFNSKKLFATMEHIDWKHEHFVKSLYFNMNPSKHLQVMENVKLNEPKISKAKKYLELYGCLSIGQGFLTEKGINFLKSIAE